MTRTEERPNWRAEENAAGLSTAVLEAMLQIPGMPEYRKVAARYELSQRYAARRWNKEG